jgi:inhibitor of cysteine peptidase
MKNPNSPAKKCCAKPSIALLFILILLGLFSAAIFALPSFLPDFLKTPIQKLLPKTKISSINPKVEKFKSEEEFQNYIKDSESSQFFGGGLMINERSLSAPMGIGMEDSGMQKMAAQPTADRVSTTNVQVAGIDEPDILKTDGQQIYFSSNQNVFYRDEPMIFNDDRTARKIAPRRYGETKVVSAFPPVDLKQIGSVDINGELLLSDNMLVVLSKNEQKIVGYDISKPQNPIQEWSLDLNQDTQINTARLKDGVLYLITNTYIYQDTPCPIRPLANLEIACTDIYHPVSNSPIDSTFTIMALDPQTGEVTKNVAFVGSMNSSTIYMSTDNLYISHSYQGDMVDYIYSFFLEVGSDLVSQTTLDKLAKLRNYELSTQSKMVELQQILQTLYQGKTDDERLQFENELNNTMADFGKTHLREMEQTGITKIDLDSLNLKASGTVPGHPLNQFSLDEYDGYLRIATTISGNSVLGFSQRNNSANDVYVLDKNLNVSGSVLDMGLGERIYAVRFLADKGYVVTFREIDPLYVLDLKNPKKPQKAGELKIPGYSSYLHPLKENILLGIGKEGSQVKLSLFDVKNPANPQEIDTYQLKEYWSEAVSNHHAFLQDEKFQIFFLPGSKGGYVFNYANNKLSLKKAISDTRPSRAVFINDYLYLIGEEGIVIYNETDWNKVNKLEFRSAVSRSNPHEIEVQPMPMPTLPDFDDNEPGEEEGGFPIEDEEDYIGL